MATNRKPPSPKAIALGRRIAGARERLNMSQEGLAKLLGVTKGAVGQYEIGYTTPRAAKLRILADALEVTVEWLLTGNEPDEQVKAQTANEMAALALIRAMPPEKQAAALAMMQGLLGQLAKV